MNISKLEERGIRASCTICSAGIKFGIRAQGSKRTVKVCFIAPFARMGATILTPPFHSKRGKAVSPQYPPFEVSGSMRAFQKHGPRALFSNSTIAPVEGPFLNPCLSGLPGISTEAEEGSN